MTISFKILGYEIWTLDADFGDDPPSKSPIANKAESLLDRAVKGTSRIWVRHMAK